jgi:hypothetical protein
MIKVGEMGHQVVGSQRKIPGQTTVPGRNDQISIFLSLHRRDPMGDGTNPTNSLRDLLGIHGMAVFQNHLESSEHLARAKRINDLIGQNFDSKCEMTFDPGQWVNRD